LQETLEEAIRNLREQRSAAAGQTANALELLRPALGTPAQECTELDAALQDAISQLPIIVLYASPEESAQCVKQLRRMILSDRCRRDPDPDRDVLNLTLCIRQALLIELRGQLLTTRQSIAQTEDHLQTISDDSEYDLIRQHLQLLRTYQQTQEEYLIALMNEIDQLRTELRG